MSIELYKLIVQVLGLQSSDDSSTLVCVTSFRAEESRMTTVDFITELFYEVDEQLRTLPKHPEARLWPSEVVTLGLLHAAQRRGEPALLSLVDARLSGLVSAAPRAHPALSSLRDPSRLDTGLLGLADRAGCH